MTPRTHDVLVSVAEMQQGRAVRRCPCCGRSIEIAMPAPMEAIQTELQPCVREGVVTLSEREQQLFDVLYARSGQWTNRKTLQGLIYGFGFDPHGISVVMTRLRHKLEGSGWRIGLSRPKGRSGQTYRLQRTNGRSVAA